MQKFSAIPVLLLFSAVLWAQEQATPPPEASPQSQGDMGGRGMRRGPGVAGTITAISDSSITVKTQEGKSAQVNLSPQTKFRKQRQDAKLADFKVGDEIFVRGQSAGADTWTAEIVAGRPAGGGQFEQRMREGMGKEFIAGEVTAINGVQLTIKRPDGVSQTISADEGTSFRRQQESITLADIKVGDHVFGRGAVKNDVFVPATLNVGDPGMMRRGPGAGPGPGSGQQGQGPSA